MRFVGSAADVGQASHIGCGLAHRDLGRNYDRREIHAHMIDIVAPRVAMEAILITREAGGLLVMAIHYGSWLEEVLLTSS